MTDLCQNNVSWRTNADVHCVSQVEKSLMSDYTEYSRDNGLVIMHNIGTHKDDIIYVK